ncbi:MAG: ABC transporter ATP-binding protein [Acidimicrobiales bacterium]
MVERASAAEVRAYGLGPTLLGRVDGLYSRRVDRMRELVRKRAVWSAGASLVSNLVAVGSVALLVKLIIDGRLDVADGGVAILALQQAADRLSSVSESVGSLGGAARFLQDYEDFVRQPVPEPVPEVVAPERLVDVRLEQVTFTYPGQAAPVLHEVDLRVAPGELVALVGVNGSGKSTIAKLMAGLYDPDAGRVVWETTAGTVTDRRRIGRLVGLVFQDFLRFELSVRDNVAFGRPWTEAHDDEVWRGLEAAGLDGVVKAHPDGVAGRLGRRFGQGIDLSAGQWQRLGIARAFFRDAPLLVLDEPTAAVDARAEQELFDVVRSLQAGRAVVLITHRMATVREADRIYVLQEAGSWRSTHAELPGCRWSYAELYGSQARSFVEE